MMSKLLHSSLILGFAVGAVFLLIAPLGLGDPSVELFKVVLLAGVKLLHWLMPGIAGSQSGGANWAIGLVSNGLVYSVLFFLLLGAKRFCSGPISYTLSVSLIVLGFLIQTGMLAEIYQVFLR